MRSLVLGIMMLLILAVPYIAKAASWSDDFDDGVMDGQWSYFDDGNTKASLFEENGVLNFVASGLSETEKSDKGYISNVMVVDFNNDFWAKVQFNSDYNGPNDNALGLGLLRGAGQDISSYTGAGISAGHEWDYGKRFWTSISDGYYQGEDRSNNEGWLQMKYTKQGDLLEFIGADISGASVLISQYANFTSIVGSEPMRVFIGAGVKGANVMANLDNFSGGIAPEPVSCALFLLGGGALALVRRKKR